MRKNSSKNLHQKNKTLSTVVHTDHQQKTTKKGSIHKTASCTKIPRNLNAKSSKASLVKANHMQSTVRTDNLTQQNKKLREQYCKLQDLHLKDKEKIKILIGRISDVKKQNLTRPQTPHRTEENGQLCEDAKCQERRKYLELELYKERIKVSELEKQKKSWEKNKERLKSQYKDLLNEIQFFRDKN